MDEFKNPRPSSGRESSEAKNALSFSKSICRNTYSCTIRGWALLKRKKMALFCLTKQGIHGVEPPTASNIAIWFFKREIAQNLQS